MCEVGGQFSGANHDLQKDAGCGLPLGAAPVARSAESSDLSSRGIRGVTAINCAWCKAKYVPEQPEGTYHKDSDGMCPACMEKWLNELQAVPVVKDPPVDQQREWGYTKPFLTSLGLWQLPGGVL